MSTDGASVLAVLELAARRAPHAYQELHDGLNPCWKRRIPETEAWFAAHLRKLIGQNGCSRPWGDLDQRDILLAAVRQAPSTDERYILLWVEILAFPKFDDIALAAIAFRGIEALDYFPRWWNQMHDLSSYSPGRRTQSALYVLLQKIERDVLVMAIEERRSWPDELRQVSLRLARELKVNDTVVEPAPT